MGDQKREEAILRQELKDMQAQTPVNPSAIPVSSRRLGYPTPSTGGAPANPTRLLSRRGHHSSPTLEASNNWSSGRKPQLSLKTLNNPRSDRRPQILETPNNPRRDSISTPALQGQPSPSSYQHQMPGTFGEDTLTPRVSEFPPLGLNPKTETLYVSTNSSPRYRPNLSLSHRLWTVRFPPNTPSSQNSPSTRTSICARPQPAPAPRILQDCTPQQPQPQPLPPLSVPPLLWHTTLAAAHSPNPHPSRPTTSTSTPPPQPPPPPPASTTTWAPQGRQSQTPGSSATPCITICCERSKTTIMRRWTGIGGWRDGLDGWLVGKEVWRDDAGG